MKKAARRMQVLNEQSLFKAATKRMPACLVGALDNPQTALDLQLAAEHECDMFNEGQDGALTQDEISQVKAFLTWLRAQ
jgi:hypothetical protein